MSANSYDRAIAAQFPANFQANQLDDVRWTTAYLTSGSPAGKPILLSMGENWEGPSDALRARLANAPSYLAGYQFSLWGEPGLVQTLTAWVTADYQFKPATNFRVAACWSGTRGALSDIGRVLGEAHYGRRLVYATPGYDYGDVMSAWGLQAHGVSILDFDTGNVSYDALPDELDGSVAAVILNVQHNPIAHQWPETVLRRIFEKCIKRKIVPIFDDAHKAIVSPDVRPVNAVGIWLEMAAQWDEIPDWYLVRSLGKQLNCNGWGIGLLAGPASAIEHLVLRVRPQREYAIQGAQQWAISQHLISPECAEETTAFITRVSQNRKALAALAPRFAGVGLQTCTPFSWFPLPQGLSRAEIMRTTGVLLGGLLPSPLGSSAGPERFAKIYLGVHRDILSAALGRLRPLIGHV